MPSDIVLRRRPSHASRLVLVVGCFLALLPVSAEPVLGASPRSGPRLTVDVRHDRHTIGADIYGVNFAADVGSATALRRLGITVSRWGGNSTTRYDWTTGFHNTGSDWYFEDIPPDAGRLPHLRHIDADRAAGRRTILTLPMIGWVPRTSAPTQHPYACGFPTSAFPDQPDTDPWDPGCGNGVDAAGDRIAGSDPTWTSRAVDEHDIAGWVRDLVRRYGRASAGGVRYLELDNEPSLWDATHRDVHPDPLTYDELIERTIAYAAAIKAADPSALVVGPSDWGWCAYLYSPADPGHCSVGSDREAHGGQPFAAWYLARLRAYERAHGTRLLDVFDEHYYPQATGVALAPAGTAAVQRLRLRSTRSLWDPAYRDESWISDTAPGGVAVRLIPRMRAWVDANDPGTRLGITEYDFGGLESLNGALAQADVLGILGREGVSLATLWGAGSASEPWAFAFRMYRDYDGRGARFGSRSVRARSFDAAQPSRANGGQDRLAVYAAQRSDGTLTVMVINKTGSALRSTLTIKGDDYRSKAQVWRYGPTDLRHIRRGTDARIADGRLTLTWPRSSITLLVLRPR